MDHSLSMLDNPLGEPFETWDMDAFIEEGEESPYLGEVIRSIRPLLGVMLDSQEIEDIARAMAIAAKKNPTDRKTRAIAYKLFLLQRTGKNYFMLIPELSDEILTLAASSGVIRRQDAPTIPVGG